MSTVTPVSSLQRIAEALTPAWVVGHREVRRRTDAAVCRSRAACEAAKASRSARAEHIADLARLAQLDDDAAVITPDDADAPLRDLPDGPGRRAGDDLPHAG